MAQLDTGENERLNTWIKEITEALNHGVPSKVQPDGSVRFGNKGSLLIGPDAGLWYDFEAGKGGRHAISLIRHLGNRDPFKWAKAFLSSRKGTGPMGLSQSEYGEASTTSSRKTAERLISKSLEITGTTAADYLNSRGIRPPFPASMYFVPNARPGEHALMAMIENDGELAAIHITYLDDEGNKSSIQPQRRLYRCRQDWRSFACLSFVQPGATDRTVIAEGLEDALSLWQSNVAKHVVASCGVNGIGKGPCIHGDEVVVFRDGDLEGSAANDCLEKGVDRMILDGARVRVTQTPAGHDANSILLSEGADVLVELVDNAPEASLSLDGEIERCANLRPMDYETGRKELARELGVRVTALDNAVNARRREDDLEANETAASIGLPEIEPWPTAVDLGKVLERAAEIASEYVFMPRHSMDALILWSAHTHLMSQIGVSPRLAVQSAGPGCGKTVTMEIVSNLVPRPLTVASITTAAVFRVIEAVRPTLLIDEADQLMSRHSHELLAVLNSSHRRNSAYVLRNVEQTPGQFEPTVFSTWAPIMFAGIRELPPTLQDRSIVLRLERALPGEVRRHLFDGECAELQECARKLKRWSLDLVEIPDIRLPTELNNRIGDNWKPLFAVAALAGGHWPTRCLTAAKYAYGENDHGAITNLLSDIHAAFGERDNITSRELIDGLIGQEEGPYSECNRGGPITPYWVAKQLKGVISGPSTTIRRGQQTSKGYRREQFKMAWQRYRISETRQTSQKDTENSPQTLVTSDTSSQRAESIALADNAERTHQTSQRRNSTPPALNDRNRDGVMADKSEPETVETNICDDVTDVTDILPATEHDTEVW